jgi:hypothetical protein
MREIYRPVLGCLVAKVYFKFTREYIFHVQ